MNGTHLHTFVDEVQATVPVLREVELVNIYQLKATTCYDRLIVIGPCRWYPEYILRAPRAQHLYFVRYSWMKDSWTDPPLFLATQWQPSHVKGKKAKDQDETMRSYHRVQPETVQEDLELPPIEWGLIEADMLQRTSLERDQDDGQARLCLLADGYAVLLDASEQAKVLILDLGEEEAASEEENALQSVRYVSVEDVQPGMFLLLRTSGGDDYLISVADQLLGEQAQQYRAMQEEWKRRLRAHVAAKNLFEVSLELIDHGSDLANEVNLSHWMSDRSIHPHAYHDFLAIMRLVDMEADAKEYWTNARRIETTHKLAGLQIRKRLLTHVTHSDLRDLHKRGRMDFELFEMGTSSLSAFRIEQISPKTFLIALSRIGRLYSTRKLSWLE